jgi:hypothetical protein
MFDKREESDRMEVFDKNKCSTEGKCSTNRNVFVRKKDLEK